MPAIESPKASASAPKANQRHSDEHEDGGNQQNAGDKSDVHGTPRTELG